jgi:molybdopterin-synthase adenylyltransferase
VSLNQEQIERYARHIMLREVGGPGQQLLLKAHVAVVGLGALGGPAALYLAAAGVGRLSLIDDDVVSLSNLQRQVLFSTADTGRPKTEAAADTLAALNPGCDLVVHRQRLMAGNAVALLSGADLVIDGTDRFASRFDINLACHTLGAPLVSGAVGRWSAQVSTFRSGLTRGRPLAERLPCYRCLVPDIPPEEETCAAVGVIGPLTGIVGARLALEAVKEITGAGLSLAGRLWVFDALSGESRTIRLPPDPACAVCGDSSEAAP